MKGTSLFILIITIVVTISIGFYFSAQSLSDKVENTKASYEEVFNHIDD